jgi:hypothetical protein
MEALFSMPPIYFALPLFLTVVGALLFGGPGHTAINIFLVLGCIVAETLMTLAVSQSDEDAARQLAYASIAVILVWLAATPLFAYIWKAFMSV